MAISLAPHLWTVVELAGLHVLDIGKKWTNTREIVMSLVASDKIEISTRHYVLEHIDASTALCDSHLSFS